MTTRFDETFEVHLRRQGVWTVERTGMSAPQARELGESEFRRAGVDGLRVVRSRSSRITGAVTEDLMVERLRTAPAPEEVVGVLDEAPVCRTLDDLLRPGPRLAMHRLFQGWLRAHEAGVTECMVSEKLLRRLVDSSGLLRSALHHAGALQTAEGEDPAAARDRLSGLAEALQARARQLEDWVVENVRGDPERLHRAAAHSGDDPDPWRGCAALVAFLSGRPTRLAKVEALIGLAGHSGQPETLNRIDMVLADYLMDPDIALELAGQHAFLSDRLQWIAATAIGSRAKAPRRTSTEAAHGFAEPLPDLIAAGMLPRSGWALLQALDAALRREAPLNDGSQAREQRAILDLVQRLGAGAGFAGGPRLAGRLARRFAMEPAADGRDSLVEAVDTMVLAIQDIPVQVRFLLALLGGSNPPKTEAGLLAVMHRVFTLYGSLNRLARRAPSARSAIAEFDALCMLIEHAHVDPKVRAAWTGAVLTCLDEAVGKRIAGGELTVQQLLVLAESGIASSTAARETLVRRLSRAAGIVS